MQADAGKGKGRKRKMQDNENAGKGNVGKEITGNGKCMERKCKEREM